MIRSKVIVTLLILLLITVLVQPALARSDRDWDVTLAPLYIWMINIEGGMSVLNKTVPVKADFGGIL